LAAAAGSASAAMRARSGAAVLTICARANGCDEGGGRMEKRLRSRACARARPWRGEAEGGRRAPRAPWRARARGRLRTETPNVCSGPGHRGNTFGVSPRGETTRHGTRRGARHGGGDAPWSAPWRVAAAAAAAHLAHSVHLVQGTSQTLQVSPENFPFSLKLGIASETTGTINFLRGSLV